MATQSLSTPIKIFSISALFHISAIIFSQANGQGNQTQLVFYLHDVASGSNATVVPIIGVKGRAWSYNSFGTIFAVDDPITLFADQNSAVVGRAQGLLAAASLDGSNVFTAISIAFTKYGGSTLELHGTSRQHENSREISVVGGTGSFRSAKGYAVLETSSYDAATTLSIIRMTVTLVLPWEREL